MRCRGTRLGIAQEIKRKLSAHTSVGRSIPPMALTMRPINNSKIDFGPSSPSKVVSALLLQLAREVIEHVT